jgi:TPP-dependent pyruvate/acetoin dehydrogenase alpha subunit
MKSYSPIFFRKLYETMVRIRTCEESLVEPIHQGMIKCPVHLYSGEEAVATGACASLRDTDYVFSTHRSHGHFLAKGGSLKELIAEVYGKETGCSKGRGGSMHLTCPERGMIGSAPIVAGTISLALGAALASKIRDDGRVTLSFFGDGASGEGVLFESLNFAALKSLPIILICENNFYSTHLPIRECRPNDRIFEIAKPLGIPGLRIDGNDVLKVFMGCEQAVTLCRNGKGPVFIECLTYRFRGHVGPDDNIQGEHTDIRPKQEVQEWRKKDPIARFERYLIREGILGKPDVEEICLHITEEVREAHSFALESPYPVRDDLMRYVFKENNRLC